MGVFDSFKTDEPEAPQHLSEEYFIKCTQCGQRLVKSYKDSWIHETDTVILGYGGAVDYHYSEHEPILDVIDITAEEAP